MLPVFDDSAVAKDIEAVCRKCGGETWHVIVAVSNGKIAKVQCKSCGEYHAYRPIATAQMTLKRDTKSAIAASTKSGSPIKAKEPKEPAAPKELTPLVPANDNPIKGYNIRITNLQLGDRINHSKYGLGVVDGMPEPGKMYVTFKNDRVLLVYGK